MKYVFALIYQVLLFDPLYIELHFSYYFSLELPVYQYVAIPIKQFNVIRLQIVNMGPHRAFLLS